MILLSLDPGIRGSGVAIFNHGKLIDAAYVTSPCRTGNMAAEAVSMASWIGNRAGGYCVDELAVEWPRIYASRIRAGESKADPNDLLALAAIDAAVGLLFSPARVHSYAPSDWKGQLSKETSQVRIKSRLTEDESKVLEDVAAEVKSKAHNVFDAVGIGLYHLGRFGRKRVIS